MRQDDKGKVVFVVLIIIVLAIILTINYIRANGGPDKETIMCIAEKSKLIVSPTCSVCAAQKQILGRYVDYFELVNINQEIAEQYDIQGVPTWIINEERYEGYQSIEDLKQITNC